MDDIRNSREQRLAAALRANLRRRKHQTRRSNEQAEADRLEQPHETGNDAPSSEGPSRKA